MEARNSEQTLDVSARSVNVGQTFATQRLLGHVLWPVTLAFCLLFLVLVLCKGALRKHQLRWMQLLATAAMMGFVLCQLVFDVFSQPRYSARFWPTAGHCRTAMIFLYWLLLLANAGMTLITVERVSTLLRADNTSGSGSCCSVAVAVVSLLLACIGTLVISVGTTLGFDVRAYVTHHGEGHEGRVCMMTDKRYPDVIYWVSMLQNLITAILTITLLIAYVVKRCRSAKPLSKETNTVIPIIVANIVFVVGGFGDALYLDAVIAVKPFFVVYPLVVVIWLLFDGEVRRAFTAVCCPCCSSGRDEEKTGLLGHH